MNRLITIIAGFFVFILSYGQGSEPNEEVYPLEKIITYCLEDSVNIFSSVKFEYDSIHRRIGKEYVMRNHLEYRTLYKYNELGILVSEEVYINRDTLKLEYIREYIYDSNQNLIRKENYSVFDKKQLIDKLEFKYDTIITTQKRFTKKCIGNDIYLFDKKGKLVEKRSPNNSSSTIKYKYNGLLLISESYYSNKNQLLKRNLFYYEKGELRKRYTELYGNVSLIGKNKKLGNCASEEYKYKDGKIIEKRTIEQGLDPCGAFCCGNYIIKYEYIKK